MKAARIHAYGHSDQIELEDVAPPTPGPDQVLVRVSAAGVNPIDWKIREGFLAGRAPAEFPITLGQDFVGTVIALGEAVTDVEASEEVYGFATGAYAEFVIVLPKMIATKPLTVDDVTAAGLPTPGLTALQCVTEVVQPKPGQVILIHGAAGSVGSVATQLVQWKGGRVVANASARDAAYLASLGVVRVIDHGTERFEDRVQDVDAVIDLVGGGTLARSYEVVRPGGVLVTTVGPLDTARTQQHRIRGVQLVMQKNRADLERLARLVDDGIVKPRPTHVLPLARVREGQDLNQLDHDPAKVVLAVG
jgi:NADPH:quinone reductase-like Zn-dependent oxidoreductase